ncbi:MAG: RNA-binding cell elongation regulator Jag/EloR [Chloroflexota bacterium]
MTTHATIEVIADNVQDAVEKGLGELGLPQEAVEVEVLDAGTRGLFGLGNRQARVRLIVKEAFPVQSESPSAPAKIEEPEALPAEMGMADIEAAVEAEMDELLTIARDTVAELLEKMQVEASVTASYGETDHDRDRTPVLVDIHGDDLSILIGKRAETLNALQYIAGLIISKQVGDFVPLMVDVEGYRVRRSNQLRQLARRMADQVAKTGRRLALEPMPASERRIIHMELREHPFVTTESVGEEPYRKLTILPKD